MSVKKTDCRAGYKRITRVPTTQVTTPMVFRLVKFSIPIQWPIKAAIIGFVLEIGVGIAAPMFWTAIRKKVAPRVQPTNPLIAKYFDDWILCPWPSAK